jgi:molybdopterin-dependent oxidoreductase alpha subunit
MPWETITQTCGLSQEEIEATAALFGNCDCVIFAWAMGVTQQANGVDNIISIANTALMTGNAGKLGAGTMPIRGHSNVQGFGSMGVTIRLRQEIATALSQLLGKPLNLQGGYDTRALIEAAEQGNINTLFCLGGNLYGANPDLTQAKQALGQIETIFYVATKPNLGHFHGLAKQNTVILPVFTRFENPHRTTTESGNNFVRFNEVGSSHLQSPEADLISEVELLINIAVKVLGTDPIDWPKLQDTTYVRQLIAQTIPGYQKMAELDQTQAEFTITGRVFTEPQFPTATGKAQMAVTPLPHLSPPQRQDFIQEETSPGIALILGTGRSYGQHNTVVYQVGDKYRGMPHRHCLLMNAQDAKKAGFQEHQRVTVQGDAGQLTDIEIIFGAIREGVGFMFYPEANCLFKAKIDPRCGTPAYKRVPVWVSA